MGGIARRSGHLVGRSRHGLPDARSQKPYREGEGFLRFLQDQIWRLELQCQAHIEASRQPEEYLGIVGVVVIIPGIV